MDSIANHPSVRRLASASSINALAAEAPETSQNANGKRSASSTSIQSLAGPAVKKLRVASATLAEPSTADTRIADGLKSEGWTGPVPSDADAIAQRQEARRQLRVAEARRKSGRKSVGRQSLAPPPPPKTAAARFIGKAAEGLRAFGNQPHSRNALADGANSLASATAARASVRRAPSIAPNSISSKGPSWKKFDLQASLSKGTKYKPKSAWRRTCRVLANCLLQPFVLLFLRHRC